MGGQPPGRKIGGLAQLSHPEVASSKLAHEPAARFDTLGKNQLRAFGIDMALQLSGADLSV